MWTSNEDWVLLYEECIYTVLTNELEVEHIRKHTEESKSGALGTRNLMEEKLSTNM